jgi:microcystin-dependent protein
LFAGDLNLLQDLVAALSDFTQTHDVAVLRIGDTSLQLLKYGTGEMRISGALRTDGILRGLGGLYAGQFTTTQRNAIPSGSRPFGLMIFNTTTAQFEFNAGSDGSPSWQAVAPASGEAVGTIKLWPTATPPTSFILCDGASLLRSGTYAGLFAVVGTTYGSADGTHFNVPDFRDRVPVGVGPTNATSLGINIGSAEVTLTTSNMPNHTHAAGSLVTANAGSHKHGIHKTSNANEGSGSAVFVTKDGGSENTAVGSPTAMDTVADHTHALSGSSGSAGSGQPHGNIQPSLGINFIIRYQ